MPQSIGVVVSSGKATLLQLQTEYGTKDLYDLLEIIAIDLHNRKEIERVRSAD